MNYAIRKLCTYFKLRFMQYSCSIIAAQLVHNGYKSRGVYMPSIRWCISIFYVWIYIVTREERWLIASHCVIPSLYFLLCLSGFILDKDRKSQQTQNVLGVCCAHALFARVLLNIATQGAKDAPDVAHTHRSISVYIDKKNK